jgi:hypothetical protein
MVMNKYILIEVDLEKQTGKQIFEFFSDNEDTAIAHVFSLFNPPPRNYNLYQLVIDTDKNYNFKKDAKIIYLPNEITADGDYVFYE